MDQIMRRTLHSLSSNTDLVSRLLQLLDESVVIIDQNGCIAGWSEGAEQLLGYEPSEVLGTHSAELYAEDERVAYRRRLQDIVALDEPVAFETTLRTRPGELRAAQVLLTRTANQHGDQYSVLCRFLARGEPGPPHRVSASQLREFWALVDSVPVAFSHLDSNRRFLYLNSASLRNIPGDIQHPIGRHIGDVFGAELYEKWRPEIDRALLGEESSSEVSFTGRDGRLRHFFRHLYPHKTVDGNVKGYFSVVVDITDTKITQESQLRREHLLRSTLVREINHRVKNSLQGLIGLMRLYGTRQDDPAALIDRCASQLMAVAVSFGLAGKHGETRILLVDMVRDIAQSVERVYRRNVRVELLAPAVERPAALSERHSANLSLVINELIFNAVKHSSTTSHSHSVAVTVDRRGDTAHLRVVNATGSLPAEFSYSDGTGLGTGLSLVKVLMPPDACELTIAKEVEGVVATLTLHPPILGPE
jgi:PAS domain S-box-containing protein